jgi:hypothetical protein
VAARNQPGRCVRRDARAATQRWHRPAQRVPRLGHQRSGVPPKAPALCSMRHSPARAGVPRAAARERASSPSTGSPLRRYSNSTERASRQMRDSALLLAHAEGGHRTASHAPPRVIRERSPRRRNSTLSPWSRLVRGVQARGRQDHATRGHMRSVRSGRAAKSIIPEHRRKRHSTRPQLLGGWMARSAARPV